MGNWNKKFLDLTELVSSWSKDRSTQVGAVVVDDNNIPLVVGYNGFPRGVDDDVDERHERPAKYYYTEHAERNAIYAAARNGIKLEGSTIYLLWKWPCADCARGVIQSGIKRIVSYNRDFPGKKKDWDIHFIAATEMLDEAGVEVIFVNEEGEVQEIWKRK